MPAALIDESLLSLESVDADCVPGCMLESIWNIAPMSSCSAVDVDGSVLLVDDESSVDDVDEVDAVDVASVEVPDVVVDAVVPVEAVVVVPDDVVDRSLDKPSSASVFSSAAMKGLVLEVPELLDELVLDASVDEPHDDVLPDCKA